MFGLCLCVCFCRRCRRSPPPGDIEMYHHLPVSGEGDGDSVISDLSDVVFNRPKSD